MVCHQRSGFGPVPGCDGGETTSSTADFCVWNGTGSLPAPEPQPTNGTFRLKLYWEEGYEWQGETFEREWCMMFNYTGYPGTNRCWIRNFTVPCNESQAYTAKCVTGEPRQWFRFVELGSPNGEPEVLIQTGDQLRCFERMNRELWLRECNESNPRQRWFALNGSFDGPRFEISQLGFTSQCIANDHHPKSGEVMELHWCEGSRWEEDQTSYWNKY